jgi:polyisoprenyl-teichoic acid--peptidoglycan teichoic acid transferase
VNLPVSPEKPPKVGQGLIKRALVAGLTIVILAAGAVSAAGFLEANDVLKALEIPGREPIDIPEITPGEAGKAQTLMILGSDERYGDKKAGFKPRSDTIILVRLDPKKEATAVVSIPRDLKVDIPGYANDRINSAYELGGPRLTVKTVKKLFSRPGQPFAINHVVNVNFGGFRRVINYVGGVYVDIDRDYFNDNSGGDNFAAIDVNPGYQKLKGQNALDYVRYRHGDNDLVRGARQQDFLRQLRSQAGVKKLLQLSQRKKLAKLFARYADSDKGLRSTKQVFSLLKLVLFTGRKPVREVRFNNDETNDPVYITASKDKLNKTVREFLSAHASSKPRQTAKETPADRRSSRKGRKRNRSASIPGLEIARREGEDQAIVGERRARFPFYFPILRDQGSRYAGTQPRTYGIRDEKGKLHRAYRLVVSRGPAGEYYGIQGMTWRAPPILDNPDERRRCTTGPKRKLELHFDGRRLRIVAWKTPRAVYWVSNTLTQSLSTPQMLGIACSLRRLGQK